MARARKKTTTEHALDDFRALLADIAAQAERLGDPRESARLSERLEDAHPAVDNQLVAALVGTARAVWIDVWERHQ